MSYKGTCEQHVTDGIVVTCANGGQLVSTATDVINYQGLPTASTPCHKFPDKQLVDPLLSLGKLVTHGCRIAFAGDKVTVTNPQGIVVLIGSKPPHWNVYTVPLPIGRARPKLPTTIDFPTPPDPAPKISGVPSLSSQNIANHIMTSAEKNRTSMTVAQTRLKNIKNGILTAKTRQLVSQNPLKHKIVISQPIREIEAI